MTFKSFLSGCWFGCTHHYRERRGTDLYLVCSQCGSAQKILPKLKFKARKVPKVVTFQRDRKRA